MQWYYQDKIITEIADLPEGAFGFTREIIHIAYHRKELTYLECKYQFSLGVLEDKKYLNDNILGKFFDKDFK